MILQEGSALIGILNIIFLLVDIAVGVRLIYLGFVDDNINPGLPIAGVIVFYFTLSMEINTENLPPLIHLGISILMAYLGVNERIISQLKRWGKS